MYRRLSAVLLILSAAWINGASALASLGPTTQPTTRPETAPAGNRIEPPRAKARVGRCVAIAVAPQLLICPASEVDGATEIRLESLDSEVFAADIVRIDESAGLALLRLKDRALPHAQLAEVFDPGPLACVSIATSAFNLGVEAIGGRVESTQDLLHVVLDRVPRRLGGALVAGDRIVGICLERQDPEEMRFSMIQLRQIRAFCAADLLGLDGRFVAPQDAICEVQATRAAN